MAMSRKENIIIEKTDAYADRIMKLYFYLKETKHETIISKQILRSGTSIGANTMESRNAQGAKDFISKLSIALKEADETEYWLKRLYRGGYINKEGYESMHQDNDEIVSILTKIVKTMKEKTSQENG